MSDNKKYKIAIADDEPYIILLLENYLSEDYNLIVANDGQELLENVQKYKPDLVLTDVMMPRLDGFSACKKIKSDPETKFIPVIILTALGQKQKKIEGLDSGADDFLTKPFDGTELKARVRSLLRIKSLHDEIQKRNEILNNILSKYLCESVSEKILENPDKYLKLGGETKRITILFADVRGFTHFSESKSAQEIVDVLNTMFTELVKVVFEYKGTFDKFMGDCIMSFYGAPISYEDDALRAIKTAISMQKVFRKLEQKMGEDISKDLGLGIGINTGEVVVGNVGSDKFMDYTVIGDNVNIAKRIEEITDKGEIIISENTYQEVKDWVVAEKVANQTLKGKTQTLNLYKVMYVS